MVPGTPALRAAAMVIIVSVLLWQETQPVFCMKPMSDRWSSGIVRDRAARTEPAGFGGLTRTGDALPGFAPALTSRSTMGVWPRWLAKSRAV